jgi:aconitate hydratase 2/2-methylisocitrate dehydratase
MLDAYRKHVQERKEQDLPPLPLEAEQVAALVELLKSPPAGEEELLIELLTHRVPPGVDAAAKVKAEFLGKVAKGEKQVAGIDRQHATFLLGTMLGGYNIQFLIDLLDDDETAAKASEALSKTLLVYDAYTDVMAKAVNNKWAGKVVD